MGTKDRPGLTKEHSGSDDAQSTAPHYKYDYDRQRDDAPARRARQKQVQQQPSPPDYNQYAQAENVPYERHDPQLQSRQAGRHRAHEFRLRMVTLLIEDRRTNDAPLLVEVKVPLRQAPPPAEFFWADAQDITRTLQESAARIDGRWILQCL